MSHIAINPYFFKPPPSISFIGSTENITDGTSFTFTNHAIGTADSTRRVVVAAHWISSTGAALTLSSATIGGNAATIHAQTNQALGVNSGTALISLLVSSGTTATIVLNLSGIGSRAYVGVYSALNEANTSPNATATDNTLTSSTTLNLDVNIPSGGWVVAAVTGGSGATGKTFTWTGATEAYDVASSEVATRNFTGASLGSLATETPRAITCVCSAALSEGCGASMSWS